MDIITNKTIEKLKYDLVRDELISYEDFEKAEELANSQNINIGQALINSGLIDEEKLLQFLELKLHIPYVDLDDYSLDSRCLKYIHLTDAKKYKMIPLFKIEDELTIAMADPLNLLAVDNVLDDDSISIAPVISSEKSILKKIEEYYNTDNTLDVITTDKSIQEYDWRDVLTQENLSDEHIHKIITAILKQSIYEDVHELFFEQSAQGLNVNFKKNSEIYNTGHISPILINSFISKMKSLSNLDPTISEIPQLGKLNFKVDDINLVASISAFPTIQGERISLKIYKPPKKLEEICKDNSMRTTIKNAFAHSGIVLVCGPDLSGKTHLIYSILEEIQNPSKNIMTIESITKYNLTNISQCELNENIGFSLDKAMRFIEFQSPDIIYFEGINTSKSFEYFTTLVYKNKVLITEFLAENMADLRTKLLNTEYSCLKQLLSCIIFIHNKNSIEVFDKSNIEKYI
ncbi:Flp pilus assembly complex ATPase component TadA [bacterium]|nr:Flp pilus assembly complex ATPase component TadA [bacterium]